VLIGAINVRNKVSDLQSKLSHAAKSAKADFHGNCMFSVSPTADTKALEQIFRHKVLLAKEKITQDMIMLLVEDPVFSGDKWRHTGFNVFFGPRILPRQEESMASGS
jgi:hypothetical protein